MYTSGKTYFEDVRFPVCLEKNDRFASIPYLNERLAITFLKKGTATLDCNSKKYIVAAPAVLLVNECAYVRLEEERNFTADSIYFHPSFINYSFDFCSIRKSDPAFNHTEKQDLYLFASFGAYPDRLAVVPLLPERLAECDFLFKKFDQAIRNVGDDYCPCWLRAVLLSLLIFLLELEKAPPDPIEESAPDNGWRIKDITLFLYSHYADALTVDGIAARFGTNRTSLNARFNKVVGTSVMRFLRSLRLNVAAKNLRTTDKTITEVGLSAGFQDISRFCKLFKEVFGCTPGAYRGMYGTSPVAVAGSELIARR